MRRRLVIFPLVGLALLLVRPANAQTQTGILQVTIVDEVGGVLRGATVTLKGRTGEKTNSTNAKGEFRFIAVDPGRYDVKAELQGFKPREETGIAVGVNETVELRLVLKVGGMSEQAEVTASGVTVDTKSTATATSLGSNLLAAIPFSHANAAVQTMNYAPGINDTSAFGGNAGTANAVLIDGVDTRDPYVGSVWAFFDFNLMEEVQIGALGQPAEYGGFTGAVVKLE